MHFSGDLTLGNLLTIATLIGIAVTFGRKLGAFEVTLKAHAACLEAVADRLNRHEDRILDVVTSLQRLMGQSEVMFRRSDEREQTHKKGQ